MFFLFVSFLFSIPLFVFRAKKINKKHTQQTKTGLAGKAPKECSPIFLQWIDSVWQIMRQFPTAFEYNESVLITIADEAYSCRFGTFLDNNERERWERKRSAVTGSLWTYLLNNQKWFTNKMYEPTESTLWVCSNPRRVVLWETYWYVQKICFFKLRVIVSL